MSNISSSPQVFISYAREDIEKADRIYSELKNAGIRVWMDKKNIFPGQNWKNAIDNAISKSRYFIPLFSSTSVTKIGYVQVEFKYALEVFKTYPPNEIFYLPVRLDDCEIQYRELKEIERVDLFPISKWEEGIKRIIQIILYKPKAVIKVDKLVVKSGEIVTLYGNESQGFKQEKLRYYWEEIPKKTISLTSNTNINPKFTAPIVDHETVFTFRLKVKDSGGQEDSTNIQIRVKPIKSGFNTFPSEGDPNFGISFEYPSDWIKVIGSNVLEVSPPSQSEIPISIFQEGSSFDMSLPVKFEITKNKVLSTDSLSYLSDSLIRDIIQAVKGSGKVVKNINKNDEEKLNQWLSNPSCKIWLKVKYPIDMEEIHLFLLTIDKDILYNIHFTAGETNYYNYSNKIDKIIESIRFI